MVYPYPRVYILQYPEGNYLGYYFININITGGGGCYGHYTKLLRWKFPASFPLIHNKFALLFIISWLFLKKKQRHPLQSIKLIQFTHLRSHKVKSDKCHLLQNQQLFEKPTKHWQLRPILNFGPFCIYVRNFH